MDYVSLFKRQSTGTSAPPPSSQTSNAPTDSTNNDSSVSGLVATLIPALLVALAYVSLFLILRRSQRRYYAPRTYLGTLREQERTPALPNGLLNWFGSFNKIPDTYALQHQSLDAYLFLRYLRVCAAIAFFGACLTWPILFPINATGSSGNVGLNILAFGNLDKNKTADKHRMFAHAFCGWIFFGLVMIMVCREHIYYINLRQAFLLSPIYANRLSSKTVLFTSVPSPYLDERKLRKVYGSENIKNVYIIRETDDVDEIVEERDKLSFKLETAEVKLIKKALKNRKKSLGKNAEPSAVADAEPGSVAARWISDKERPTMRLGPLGLLGRKVDSIDYCREALTKLIPDGAAAQTAYRAGTGAPVGAVFITFHKQSDAQGAYQMLSHHQALHMSPRYIGMHPEEIVWKSLKISWWQKVVRRYVVMGAIAALIIFWAIPVAAVGLISNVPQLMTYSWLSWLEKIPKQILGVISGLLPSVLLAVLMSLVPIIMRIMAKLSGEPTISRVELFTQNAYFAFQVVQVFLVVTLGSSAASVIKDLSDNPTSITGTLAKKLPMASNFYISYFILQGLTIASSVISQIVGFIIFNILYKFLTSTPRSMYNKWTTLSAISWGSVLPVYSNIVVIGITYSMIAPLVLGFAAIGIYLFYLAYRYNILFVSDSTIDTKGLIYPRALQHILTGVYLAQICMIGLFALSTAIGPLIITIIGLICSVLFHLSMNAALNPLLYNLPRSLEVEEESWRPDPAVNQGRDPAPPGELPASNEKILAHKMEPAPHAKPNFIMKFLKPHIYADYATLRRLVPHDLINPDNLYNEEIESEAYFPPSVKKDTPLLWIPRDGLGISRQEINETPRIIPITDEGATINDDGKIEWEAQNSEGARPPIWEEKIYY